MIAAGVTAGVEAGVEAGIRRGSRRGSGGGRGSSEAGGLGKGVGRGGVGAVKEGLFAGGGDRDLPELVIGRLGLGEEGNGFGDGAGEKERGLPQALDAVPKGIAGDEEPKPGLRDDGGQDPSQVFNFLEFSRVRRWVPGKWGRFTGIR